LYVVEKGTFDIFVKSGDKTRKVAVRGPGTCFGELALMYNAPRAATVTVNILFI
jgi:cAMP-dependent protein kinase regulator